MQIAMSSDILASFLIVEYCPISCFLTMFECADGGDDGGGRAEWVSTPYAYMLRHAGIG